MKKVFSKSDLIKSLSICLGIATIFAFIPQKPSLVGKWSILNPNGSPSTEIVDFKKDNTYTVSLPDGQIGESGNYLLKDSIFSIKNIKDVCGKDYWGKYKLNFWGADSLHFTVIEDTCSERKMDMVGYNPGLKRYKTK